MRNDAGIRTGYDVEGGRPSAATRYMGCAVHNKIYLVKIEEKKAGEDLKSGHGKFELQANVHQVLTGNAATVSHIMFSRDSQYLVSNGRDGAINIYRTQDGQRQRSIHTFRDLPMDGQWTNILGWPVMGIWAMEYDLSVVNCVCSHNQHPGFKHDQEKPEEASHVCLGDDNGAVRLFTYPACYKDPPRREYYGHGGPVSAVQFCHTQPMMLSASSAEGDCVIQWRLESDRKEVQNAFTAIAYPWTQFANSKNDTLDNILGSGTFMREHGGDTSGNEQLSPASRAGNAGAGGAGGSVPFQGDAMLFNANNASPGKASVVTQGRTREAARIEDQAEKARRDTPQNIDVGNLGGAAPSVAAGSQARSRISDHPATRRTQTLANRPKKGSLYY